MKDLKDKMMDKKVWAVVGVTENRAKFGYKDWKILQARNYEVYGVNPMYDSIEGQVIYPSLSDLPEKPDVVNMVINPSRGKEVLEEAAKLGIKYIFFQPGSYDAELMQYTQDLGLEGLFGDCVYATLV